jgi:hypothetical protein
MSEHSHEIGLANLPFTKRGRKLQAEQQQSRARNRELRGDSESSKTPPPIITPDDTDADPSTAGPSTVPAPQQAPMPSPNSATSISTFQIPLIPQQQTQSQAPPQPLVVHPPQPLIQERWERMNVLFQGIRENARTFEYPGPSVAALESILIRLYLESPMGGGT